MKKWYYIPSENKLVSFTIQFTHNKDGKKCYFGHSTINGEEVWLYDDAIEYCERNGNQRNKHVIVDAYEVREPIGFTPNEYVWGGEIRDKRAHSMCARPYFKY